MEAIHFDIVGEKDVLTRPSYLAIRNTGRVTNEVLSSLKYHADLLTGLNLHQLCLPKNSVLNNHISVALSALDPHYTLNIKAANRISNWLKRSSIVSLNSNLLTQMVEIIKDATSEKGLSVTKLLALIPFFEKMETELKRPLLYNFELDLPNEILSSFHILSNLLFYVRCLVITDYNQQIQDPTFESIRMDSVHDYLPKLESIARDAAIYSHFIRFETQMPTLVAQRLKEVFHNYSSMGVTLIDSVDRVKPSQSFGKDLSESMTQLQFDWLFGTSAGICYRLREELTALRDGYHKIFHLDIPTDFHQENASWSFDCLLPTFETSEYPAA
jgi:hypothetical protein